MKASLRFCSLSSWKPLGKSFCRSLSGPCSQLISADSQRFPPWKVQADCFIYIHRASSRWWIADSCSVSGVPHGGTVMPLGRRWQQWLRLPKLDGPMNNFGQHVTGTRFNWSRKSCVAVAPQFTSWITKLDIGSFQALSVQTEILRLARFASEDCHGKWHASAKGACKWNLDIFWPWH